MRLNNLKPAWRQLKMVDAMQHINSNEILSIIENHESSRKTKLQRLLLELFMVTIIIIFCQGG